MMVSCPGCNHQYSLDESKISPRGAMLTCLECGKKWPLRRTAEVASPAPVAGVEPAAAPAVTVSGRMEASRPARGAAAPETSGAHRQPVSCPRCGHAFQPTTGTAAAPPSQPKVLLIEDQNYFAELAREALAGDCETTVVANLAGARAAMAAGSFELVILDLGLEEGQDGAQLLGTLRQKSIPVLVFTARDETELYGGVWDTLQGAGATDILIKGMNVGEELRQKVRSLLGRPRA
jgi:predicted Zn finger-like uncharacterized protein